MISGSGRSPGVGNGNPCQYSCLENSMDRGTWWDRDRKELEITDHTHICRLGIRGMLHYVLFKIWYIYSHCFMKVTFLLNIRYTQKMSVCTFEYFQTTLRIPSPSRSFSSPPVVASNRRYLSTCLLKAGLTNLIANRIQKSDS